MSDNSNYEATKIEYTDEKIKYTDDMNGMRNISIQEGLDIAAEEGISAEDFFIMNGLDPYILLRFL